MQLAPLEVNEGVPSIVCCDLWPRDTLTPVKMAAYRKLITDGLIRIRRVVYHKGSGYITIDYRSQLPHQWTLNRLRETAATLDPGTQVRLEDLT